MFLDRTIDISVNVGGDICLLENEIYRLLAEIPGVARDSRSSERIRVICLSPGYE
jgi:hypothetical protein